MRSSLSSSADPLALPVAFPAASTPIGPPYQVVTLVRVSLGAFGPSSFVVPLPRGVLTSGHGLEMVRVDAPTMDASLASWAGFVLGVAEVVDLLPIRDWAFQVLVGPAVCHLFGLPWAWLEVSVSVRCSLLAHPQPASVGLRFGKSAEPC